MKKDHEWIEFYPFSDVGRREAQEDYFYTDPPKPSGQSWLGVVADGMGGHEHGSEASQAGVHAIKQAFDSSGQSHRGLEHLLESAVAKGNDAVLHAAERRGASGNMGSTVVALAIHGQDLVWCCAGDSRLYLYRDHRILQLSRDFTLAEDLRRGADGESWTTQEAESAPRAKALTSFMGADEFRRETKRKELEPGDVLIACTDGVYGTLNSEGLLKACEIEEGRASAKTIADALHQAVKAAGRPKQDNATAVVVRYHGQKSSWIRHWPVLGLATVSVGVAAVLIGIFLTRPQRPSPPAVATVAPVPSAPPRAGVRPPTASEPSSDSQKPSTAPSPPPPVAGPVPAPEPDVNKRLTKSQREEKKSSPVRGNSGPRVQAASAAQLTQGAPNAGRVQAGDITPPSALPQESQGTAVPEGGDARSAEPGVRGALPSSTPSSATAPTAAPATPISGQTRPVQGNTGANPPTPVGGAATTATNGPASGQGRARSEPATGGRNTAPRDAESQH